MATSDTPASERSFRPSKLDDFSHLVGVQSDAEVAALAGLSAEAVRLYRKRRGIPSARARAVNPDPPADGLTSSRGSRSKLEQVRELVGVWTDGAVASHVGLTRSAVQMFRMKHGIPAARPAGRSSRPEEAAAPAMVVWRVVVSARGEERVRYAVANDATAALAAGARLGDVVTLERLGEALRG